MSTADNNNQSPSKVEAGVKLRGAEKVARIPVKVIPTEELPRKPDWIRVRMPAAPGGRSGSSSCCASTSCTRVCEEASCPNLGECFGQRHRHLHDHGRHLHPPLPVLRRRPRPAQRARPGRAAEPGARPSPTWA